ncbi:MAG: hypothetical protein P8173_15805 [Gammaproteobacteria bacterium]
MHAKKEVLDLVAGNCAPTMLAKWHHWIVAVVRIALKRTGLTLSLAFHAAVLLVLLLGYHRSSPGLLSIPVAIDAQLENIDSGLLAPRPEVAAGFIGSRGKPASPRHQPSGGQPLVVAKLTRGPEHVSQSDAAGHLNESFARAQRAHDPNNLRKDIGKRPQPKQADLVFSTPSAPHPGTTELVEQHHPKPPRLTVTSRTDWRQNPMEAKELKYSAPGGTVRLTAREASSAGLIGTNFGRGFNDHDGETSELFGLAPAQWATNTMAKSQKVEWTAVNLENFGVTVFGYENEVGSGFKPFGKTAKEFATAGTKTTKAGGQVRVGAFSLAFAHSWIAKIVDSPANLFMAQEPDANLFATKNEGTITLSLPKLLTGLQEPVSNMLPNLWASVGVKRTSYTGSDTGVPADTVSTSFGGTWNWNNNYASLGYWSYSSAKTPGLGSTWGGRGYAANVGTYHSSFGIDAGLSYGQSENAAAFSQSANTLYNSYVTISYYPRELPAISVTAAAGNYDFGMTYSATSSDLYETLYTYSSHGAYSRLMVGLDFTNWLWRNQTGGRAVPHPSVKLLYQYAENAFSDNSAQTVKDTNSLLAMMIRGEF